MRMFHFVGKYLPLVFHFWAVNGFIPNTSDDARLSFRKEPKKGTAGPAGPNDGALVPENDREN